MKKQQFELILCSVQLNQSELVIKTAKENGVTNATMLKGRGSGDYESQSMMGVTLQPEKELIMMIVPKEKRRKVMQEIAQVAGLNTPADGICFSMPIEGYTGILPKLVVPKPQKDDESKQLSVFEIKSKQNEKSDDIKDKDQLEKNDEKGIDEDKPKEITDEKPCGNNEK